MSSAVKPSTALFWRSDALQTYVGRQSVQSCAVLCQGCLDGWEQVRSEWVGLGCLHGWEQVRVGSRSGLRTCQRSMDSWRRQGCLHGDSSPSLTDNRPSVNMLPMSIVDRRKRAVEATEAHDAAPPPQRRHSIGEQISYFPQQLRLHPCMHLMVMQDCVKACGH